MGVEHGRKSHDHRDLHHPLGGWEVPLLYGVVGVGCCCGGWSYGAGSGDRVLNLAWCSDSSSLAAVNSWYSTTSLVICGGWKGRGIHRCMGGGSWLGFALQNLPTVQGTGLKRGAWGKTKRKHLKSPYLEIHFSIFRDFGCSSAQVSSSFTRSVTLITLASHFFEPSVTY